MDVTAILRGSAASSAVRADGDRALGTAPAGGRRMRSALRLALLAIAAPVLGAAPAGAATYYVAPGGSDGAAGTSAGSAFRTIDRLNRVRLRPGDRVVLRSGATFTGTLKLFESGTASAPITITTSTGHRAILDGRGRGQTLIAVQGAHLRIAHLELRRISHAPVRRNDGAAVHLGPSADVAFSDMVIAGARTAFMNGRDRATGIRISHVSATGAPTVAGSGVSINSRRSTGWRVSDSSFVNFGDSCVIDQAGRSRYTRLTVRHCGYSNLSYGMHGLYLKGPGAVLENSQVSDIRRGVGQCVSVRAGGIIRGNRLQGCTIGIGFFDYMRSGRTQRLEISANTITRTEVSPIYVDAVGTSPDTAARHTLSLVLQRNSISAITRSGGTISENGVGIHAPIRGSRLQVTSTGNRISGKIPSGAAVLAVFYDVPRWPRGSSYHGFGNSYRDLNRGAGTRFKAPGIRRPYGLRQFGAALGLGGIAARFREAGSRIAPR